MNEKEGKNEYNSKRRSRSLANFLQSSKDQIIITDINGKILFVNNLLIQTTGYSLNEVIGNNPRMWGGQMSKNFYEFIWNKLKKEKKTVSTVVTNITKDGKKYNAHLRISPVLNSSGEIEFFVGIETVI